MARHKQGIPGKAARTEPAPPTPLQAALDRIVVRIPDGLRIGCLATIEEVRNALDGTNGIAVAGMRERVQVAEDLAAGLSNELKNATARLATLEDAAAKVRETEALIAALATERDILAKAHSLAVACLTSTVLLTDAEKVEAARTALS